MTDITEQTIPAADATPENTPTSGERDTTTGKFLPGRSGNKGGRPKDELKIRDSLRKLGPLAVRTIRELMEPSNPPRIRLAASIAALEHGFGKPRQALEISTDPERPPPTFGISFALGGPGNPLDPDDAEAARASVKSETEQGVDLSGDIEVSGDVESLPFDEPPLSRREPNSLRVHAPLPSASEAPRLPPDPEHPNAVTIDAHDGGVWRQLADPARDTRAQAHAARQEALDRRRRENQERNEAERLRALEAQRIREAKMSAAEGLAK